MQPARFTTETTIDGVLERDFVVGDVPGVLWSPATRPAHSPLVLMGHGGGQHKRTPAQVARALHAARTWGFTVAAIDAPGHGDRPRTPTDERAQTAIREAVVGGDASAFEAASVAYAHSLTERALPEWRAVIDALQRLPEIGEGPVGYGGGISLGTAIGVPLVASEPRIRAAVLGGGFFVHEGQLEAARRITVPVQFLLPWDDEYVDRTTTLALFDAFASSEKALHANPGDHRTVRWTGIDDTFLARHLGSPITERARA